MGSDESGRMERRSQGAGQQTEPAAVAVAAAAAAAKWLHCEPLSVIPISVRQRR